MSNTSNISSVISPDVLKTISASTAIKTFGDQLKDKTKEKVVAVLRDKAGELEADLEQLIKDEHQAGVDHNNELKRLNIKPILKSDILDTLQIARSKFPGVGNSLDALCKRFKISIEAREKHSALLDCHLLSKVYIELIDKKELTLDLMSNDKIFNEKMKLSNENREGIVVKISPEQMDEYKKFLKKNVSNAFALD